MPLAFYTKSGKLTRCHMFDYWTHMFGMIKPKVLDKLTE